MTFSKQENKLFLNVIFSQFFSLFSFDELATFKAEIILKPIVAAIYLDLRDFSEGSCPFVTE